MNLHNLNCNLPNSLRLFPFPINTSLPRPFGEWYSFSVQGSSMFWLISLLRFHWAFFISRCDFLAVEKGESPNPPCLNDLVWKLDGLPSYLPDCSSFRTIAEAICSTLLEDNVPVRATTSKISMDIFSCQPDGLMSARHPRFNQMNSKLFPIPTFNHSIPITPLIGNSHFCECN